MEVKLSCPQAEYRARMRIYCKSAGGWCGNVYFKSCKGWWVLTDAAAKCPIRTRTDKDGDENAQA